MARPRKHNPFNDPEDELELTEEQQRVWDESNAQPDWDEKTEREALERATPEQREAYAIAKAISEHTTAPEYKEEQARFKAEVEARRELEQQEVQARYIAAYTGREPDEIPEAERKAAQDFWNTHPQAVADFFSCRVADEDKQLYRIWLETDNSFLKYIIFYGANLLEAYKAFDDEGRALITETLKKGCAVYTRAYAKAEVLPTFTIFIIPILSEEQRLLFSNAVRDRELPEDEEQAALFTLYVMLFDMADDDTKDKAAAAIGLTADDITTYLYLNGTPDKAVFPPNRTKPEKKPEEKPEPEAEAETDTAQELLPVKRRLEQKPAPNRTGFMPLSLANVSRSLLGIPLDGLEHVIGKGENAVKIKLTVKEYSGLLPFPLDNWAEKISTIIGQGRAEGQYYFEVTDIARYILYGDPLAQKTYIVKSGKNKDSKVTKLERVSPALADLVDRLIDFMQGIEAEITYPIWVKDRKGKPYLDRVTITRRLITGAFRVEIGKYANYGHTTKNNQPLRVWGFAPISDKVKDRFAPVLYEIASSLGQIGQIPQDRADIRHYLSDDSYITKDAVNLRDEMLRQTHFIEWNGGEGTIDVRDIEKRAIAEPADVKKTEKYRRRKQRAEQIARMVEQLAEDGVIYGNVAGRIEGRPNKPAKYDTTEGRRTGKYDVTTTKTREKRERPHSKTKKTPPPKAD